MTINEVRDKIRALSNPEGVNQYTKGGGSRHGDNSEDKSSNMNKAAYDAAVKSGDKNARLKEEADKLREEVKKASQLTMKAEAATSQAWGYGKKEDHQTAIRLHEEAATAHEATGAHETAAFHKGKADWHRQAIK